MHDNLKKDYDSVLSRLSERNLQSQSSIQFSPTADNDTGHSVKDQSDNRLEDLEDELDRRQVELLRLTEVRKVLEVTNSDLIRRLEMEQSRVEKLKHMVEEYEAESQTREATLAKAQCLIKKLNEECENTTRDLKRAEDAVDHLKKNNRMLERSYVEMQRQMHEVSIMKKTEERLRTENTNLKKELHGLSMSKENAVGELSHAVVQLEDDKQLLEGGIEELEIKLEEIERQSASRDEEIRLQQVELAELREALLLKESQLQKAAKDLENREADREEEVGSMKRHYENVMKQMQNLQGSPAEEQSFTAYNKLNRSRAEGGRAVNTRRSTEEGLSTFRQQVGPEGGRSRVSSMKRNSPSRLKSKTSIQKVEDKENAAFEHKADEEETDKIVVSPITTQSLALQLEESLVRERDLKVQLHCLVEREAAFLQARLNQLSYAEAAIKPELERWIMRNEELEQRLLDLSDKNSRLLRLMSDCQKTILIKNKQMEEAKKGADELREALVEALEFRGVELLDRQSLLQKEVLPKAEQAAAEMASIAQGQAILLREENQQQQNKQRETEKALEEERRRTEELQGEIAHLKGVCSNGVLDREAIERQLRQPRQSNNLEGVSREVKAIVSWIIELQKLEDALQQEQHLKSELQHSHTQLKTVHRDLELTHSQSLNDAQLLMNSRENDWLKEKRDLLNQIEEIREAAINDRLTKQKELEALEQSIDLIKERCLILDQQNASAAADNSALRQRLDKTIQEATKDREHFSQELEETISRQKQAEADLVKAKATLTHTEMEGRALRDELNFTKTRHLEELSCSADEVTERQSSKGFQLQSEQSIRALREFYPSQDCYPLKKLRSSQNTKREFDIRDSQSPDLKPRFLRSDTDRLMATSSADITRSRSDLEASLWYLEKVVDQKNTVIADLEHQLQTLHLSRSFKTTPMRDYDEEGRDDREFNRTIEFLENTVEKLNRKKDSDKRSFQKRKREFELILRYLEEKINEATEFRTRATVSEDKMPSLIKDLAQKNPTLVAWLRVLSNKLDAYCQTAQMQLFREKRTYSEVVTLLLDNSPLFVDLGELAELYNELTGVNARIDLDLSSQKMLTHLAKYVKQRESGGSHRRMRSGASIRS